MASMLFANAYARYYGVRATALRYFCVYGPRQDYRRTIPPIFSAVIIKLLKGEQPVIYGTGEKRRDFIHVDDVNDFHLQCMKDDRTTGKVFNLGSGVNYSINEIYALIASLLQSPVKPLYKPDLPGEAFANLADISEARALGWSPRTDLKSGLQTSIEFIKNELKGGRI
jgi:nucleoside-diphosphate-sugar epimerase